MSNILPIVAFRDQIVQTVANNPVTIVVAETGAGKSTMVPLYLMEAGFNLVITQPRRLAAVRVAERVAQNHGTRLGNAVGYRIADKRKDSAATRCLFATDGLALVRELVGARDQQVLVIDEVHEWNLNIEVLVAWAHRQIKENPNFKLVLMSATLEAERLASYFGNAPIVSVPGRLFPVEELEPVGKEIEDGVLRLLRQGHNVLVFQPGKAEIEVTVRELRKAMPGAEILPLHGELSAEAQAQCFQRYDRPKCVVATNVAQTSITIGDITAVVDSGMERRVELIDGVEGLYLMPISRACSQQRKGRAGRTQPGVYVDRCTTPPDERLSFPMPEILRTRLDQAVLRLAVAGFDMEELTFFHQPDPNEIRAAKQTLRLLGCMDDNGQVTKIGKLVSKLPVSVRYARMIVEAEKLGVVDDVVTAAAILEQGELNVRVCERCAKLNFRSCSCWRGLIGVETRSDVLAQLKLYEVACGMNRETMIASGIFAKAFYGAKDKRSRLVRELRGKVKSGTTGDRDSILRAVCAGMVDHLYGQLYGNKYHAAEGVARQLAMNSVVGHSQWIVGMPWDLQARKGGVIRLIRMVSAVDPAWMVDVAPQLARLEEGLRPSYSPERDAVVSETDLVFNGQVVKTFTVTDQAHPEAAELLNHGRNERQWHEWLSNGDRPVIKLPDYRDFSASVPDVSVHAYGKDATTGQPLEVYATVAVNAARWRESDPYFQVVWTRSRREALSYCPEAIRLFAHLQLQAQRRDSQPAYTVVDVFASTR